MQKISIFFGIYVGLFLFFTQASFAQVPFVPERIINFDASIQIQKNSDILVKENITYDFASNRRRGIFRTIPIKYKTNKGKERNIQISNISVVDGGGQSYKFKKTKRGDNIEIRIGEENKFITGRHVYQISYKVSGIIKYFDEYDELYWNVTGDKWQVPIIEASANVIAPKIIKIDCFSGAFGSTDKCDEQNLTAKVARFEQVNLSTYSGLTIVVAVPKGVLSEPGFVKKIWQIVKNNWILAMPLIVVWWMFRRWFHIGRDPKGRGTIVPQWEIPDDLSPSEIGIIFDEKVHRKDVSVLFIDLAIRGYLRIKLIEKGGIFGNKKDYQIIKQKDWGNEVQSFEKIFLKALFDNRYEVLISDLKNEFYKDFEEITDSVYKESATKKYFVKNPQKVRSFYFIVGFLILLFVVIVLDRFGEWVAIAGYMSGAIVMLFSFVMPKRTRKGVLLREQILGLKDYLSIAEKDRIKFHNAPEQNPEMFQKYLPYAMVLGVVDIWAKEFADVYIEQPKWYEGGKSFDSTSLASAMTNFSSVATTAATSGGNSGGGGFSGGSSGGGGGGGGGGSW